MIGSACLCLPFFVLDGASRCCQCGRLFVKYHCRKGAPVPIAAVYCQIFFTKVEFKSEMQNSGFQWLLTGAMIAEGARSGAW